MLTALAKQKNTKKTCLLLATTTVLNDKCIKCSLVTIHKMLVIDNIKCLLVTT